MREQVAADEMSWHIGSDKPGCVQAGSRSKEGILAWVKGKSGDDTGQS